MLSSTIAVVDGEKISLYSALQLGKLNENLQFIQDAIDSALVCQAAKEHGVEVCDEELQSAADEFRIANDLNTEEATEAWLAKRRLSFLDWEELLHNDILTKKLRSVISGGKVEQHFAQNRLAFDSVEISRIVAAEEGVARELRAQVVDDGADFYALARHYSRDEHSKRAGGYVGVVMRADLEAALEAAVFGAKPGQVVGPFKTDNGWELIKIEALHSATLNDTVRECIGKAIFDEWLAERRRQTKIELPVMEEIDVSEDESQEPE